MKHLFVTGVILALALAFALPVEAQAQGVDCGNLPTSYGAIPPEIAELCGPDSGARLLPEDGLDGLMNPTDNAVVLNEGANTIERHVLNTPGTRTLVGPKIFPDFANAMDLFGADLSQAFAIDGVGSYWSIDLANGQQAQIGPTGVPNPSLDLAYDPVDDVFWTCNQQQLFVIDETTGAGTSIGNLGLQFVIGLGVNLAGELWGFDIAIDQYVSIDKTTGLATATQPIGFSANFGQGMDFDPSDDQCYLFAFNDGTFVPELRSCGFGTPIPSTLVGNYQSSANQISDGLVELPSGPAGGGEVVDPVDPNRQLGKQVHLPILNFQGQDDVCRTWIEVQVIGPEFSKAVLVTWGEPGFCPPQCAGPLKVECTGLLKPGSTWNFLGSQVPTGSKGGMLFKFTAKQISEIDPTFGGEDDIVADYMCETLFFGVVGDCDDWRRFKKAYNEGREFAGLNMNQAAGKGFLAVDVLRHCPGDVTPGVEVSSKYNGIAGDHLGAFDPIYGGYGFYVPLLYADKAGFNSVMYIQNGGLECSSSIEIWFKAQDDCLRARICEIFTLAPGETYQFDASDCVGPDWQGSAWLRAHPAAGHRGGHHRPRRAHDLRG